MNIDHESHDAEAVARRGRWSLMRREGSRARIGLWVDMFMWLLVIGFAVGYLADGWSSPRFWVRGIAVFSAILGTVMFTADAAEAVTGRRYSVVRSDEP